MGYSAGYSKNKAELQFNDIEYESSYRYIDSPNESIKSMPRQALELFKPRSPMLVPSEAALYFTRNHELTDEQLWSLRRGICDYLSYMQVELPDVESIYTLDHLQMEFLKTLYSTRDIRAFVAADKFHKHIIKDVPTFKCMDPNVVGYKPFGLSRTVASLDYLDMDHPDSFNDFILDRLDNSLEEAEVFNCTYLYKERDGEHGDFNTKGPKWSCLLEKILYTDVRKAVLLIENSKFDFSNHYYKDKDIDPLRIIREHAKSQNTDVVLKALDNVGIAYKRSLWDVVFSR